MPTVINERRNHWTICMKTAPLNPYLKPVADLHFTSARCTSRKDLVQKSNGNFTLNIEQYIGNDHVWLHNERMIYFSFLKRILYLHAFNDLTQLPVYILRSSCHAGQLSVVIFNREPLINWHMWPFYMQLLWFMYNLM